MEFKEEEQLSLPQVDDEDCEACNIRERQWLF